MTLSSRSIKVLAFLFVASLAVNFFLAGIFFSQSGRPHFRMMGPRAENTVFMRGGPGSLSREGREVLRDALKGQGASFRDHAEAMSKAQEAIREALKAKPFDPQALAAAQVQMRQAVDAIQVAIQDGVADVATKLSDADRAALANMPVQSPMVAFRHPGTRGDFGPGGDRGDFRDLPPGATPPPAPGDER